MARFSLLWISLVVGIAMGAVQPIKFALISGSTQSTVDFNAALTRYLNATEATDPRGDQSRVTLLPVTASALTSFNFDQSVIGVIGGTNLDTSTFMIDYVANQSFPPALFAQNPNERDFMTDKFFALGAGLQQRVHQLVADMTLNLQVDQFAVISDTAYLGAALCSEVLLPSLDAALNLAALPSPGIIPTNGNATAALIDALSGGAVNALMSCAIDVTRAQPLALAAARLGIPIAFPLLAPTYLKSALAAPLYSIALNSTNLIWVAVAGPLVTETTDPLVQFCRSKVKSLASEFELLGCVAGSVLSTYLAQIGTTAGYTSAALMSAANRIGVLNVSGFPVGPTSSTCRFGQITARSATLQGGVIVRMPFASQAAACTLTADTRFPPVLALQVVLDAPHSVAVADDLLAGINAWVAQRDVQTQSPVRVVRALVPTPDGPLPSWVDKISGSQYFFGAIGSVDVSPALFGSLQMLSLGRESTHLYSAKRPDAPEFFDALVFSQVESSIDSAVAMAYQMAGGDALAPLFIFLDDEIPVEWRTLCEQRVANVTRARSTATGIVVMSAADTVRERLGPGFSFGFILPIGDPVARLANDLCRQFDFTGNLSIIVPTYLSESVAFANALESCIRGQGASNKVLYVADAVPLTSGLAGAAARGFVLASIADQMYRSSAQVDRNDLSPNPAVTAYYHASGFTVGGYTYANASAIDCAVATVDQRCGCNSLARVVTVKDEKGGTIASIVIDECARSAASTSAAQDAQSGFFPGLGGMIAISVVCFIALVSTRIRIAFGFDVEHYADNSAVDARMAKAVRAEVEAMLPWLHRHASVATIPYFLVTVAVAAAIIATLYDATVNDYDDMTRDIASLAQVSSALRCTQSFVKFYTPATQNYVGAVNLAPVVVNNCKRAYAAAGIHAPSNSVSVIAGIVAKLNASIPLAPQDLACGVYLLPLLDQLAGLGLTASTHDARIIVAAQEAMRLALTLSLAIQTAPIKESVARASGLSSSSIVMIDDARKLYVSGVLALNNLHFLALDADFARTSLARDFLQSDDSWTLLAIFRCFASSAIGGYLTDQGVACVAALSADSDLTAFVARLARQVDLVVPEIQQIIDRAASDPGPTDLRHFQYGIWVYFGLLTIVAFFAARLAAVILRESTQLFNEAVTRAKLIEANIAKYIGVAMLEMLNLSSVHDIAPEPIIRSMVCVHVHFSWAMAAAMQRTPTHSEAIIIKDVARAVSASLNGKGCVESLTDNYCTILFDDMPDAMDSVLRLESSLRAVFSQRKAGQGGEGGSIGLSDESDSGENEPEQQPSTDDVQPIISLQPTADNPDAVFGVLPSICIGVHSDSVALGFLGADQYLFASAFGPGVRTARFLAQVARQCGARVLVGGSAFGGDLVAPPGTVYRDLGSARGRYAGPVDIHELCLASRRGRADEYKRTTVDLMAKIADAQRNASNPPTPDDLRVYSAAVQEASVAAMHADVTDLALAVKQSWAGNAPYDEWPF